MRTRIAPAGRAVAVGGLVAAVTLATAACSGDEGDERTPSSTEGGEAEAPEGACTLLDADEVSAVFGTEAAVVPASEGASSERTCLWEATGDEGDFPTRYQLMLALYDDSRPLDPSAWGDGAQPVADLGDEAFLVPAGPLGATAGYRDGDRSVVLRYAIVGGEGAPAPGDQADELVELLRATASRGGAPA